MTADKLMFFNTMSGVLPLYGILRDKLLTECPDTTLKVRYGYGSLNDSVTT